MAAGSVAVAIVLVALVSYMEVKDQLRGQIDSTLRTQGDLAEEGNPSALGDYQAPALPASAGGPAPYEQVVLTNGTSHVLAGAAQPVTSSSVAVAQHRDRAFM